MSTIQATATLDDLYRVEGKAELIGMDKAFADGIGYALHPPLGNGRPSFSPDASYHAGPPPANRMHFIGGTPTFAVAVRCENDFGPAAEVEMEAKQADDFEAGTLVVWDVDPVAKTIAAYRGDTSNPVAPFAPGQVADADPAVRDWTLSVDEQFT